MTSTSAFVQYSFRIFVSCVGEVSLRLVTFFIYLFGAANARTKLISQRHKDQWFQQKWDRHNLWYCGSDNTPISIAKIPSDMLAVKMLANDRDAVDIERKHFKLNDNFIGTHLYIGK